jgi:heme/copper-type cytochrome/quinol oxidase subunit 3
MSTAATPLPSLAIDDRRGTIGMSWFILTEASLFVMLFFSYFYLGRQESLWPPDPPPKLLLPLPMLAILLTSSIVLHWGEKGLTRGHPGRARPATGVTIMLGLAFLALQTIEYRDKLKHLTPTTNAYGSIFYTITSLHAAHVVLGLCMLLYVLLLPELEPDKPPHRPLHNASLYWHFVDAVWVLIVAFVYVLPHVTRFGA